MVGKRQASPEAQATFRTWLSNQYQKAKSKNPYYSMRAFSKKLGLSPSFACEVLQGKRNASHLMIRKVMQKLMRGQIMEELLCDECHVRIGWISYAGPRAWVVCDECHDLEAFKKEMDRPAAVE